MARRTVSLIVRDEDTGKEHPVSDHVSSGDLHDWATGKHCEEGDLSDAIQIALNPILCQEIAESN